MSESNRRALTSTSILFVLTTHGGKFHCDEVFAYVVLRLALGLNAPSEDHALLRVRKAELIEAADVIWDVCGVLDAAGLRFDHHQRGAPAREDGTPFSSAGLVWQVFGEAAVAALSPAGAEEFANKFALDSMEAWCGGSMRSIMAWRSTGR